MKSWQRQAGKVSLKEGERAFVLSDGTVLASDTKNPKFVEYMKNKYDLKAAKRRAERKKITSEMRALRTERNNLKRTVAKGESAARREYRRILTKKEQMQKLQTEIEAIESGKIKVKIAPKEKVEEKKEEVKAK